MIFKIKIYNDIITCQDEHHLKVFICISGGLTCEGFYLFCISVKYAAMDNTIYNIFINAVVYVFFFFFDMKKYGRNKRKTARNNVARTNTIFKKKNVYKNWCQLERQAIKQKKTINEIDSPY